MSFQIYFTDMRQELSEEIRVCVSNSEEEFRNTTVEELKIKLIPGDQLGDTILVYRFKTLKKNRTLGFYGIKDEDHIYAVRRGSYYTRTTQLCSSESEAHTETIFYEDDDDDDDEGGGLPRTESMDRIVLMQKTEP